MCGSRMGKCSQRIVTQPSPAALSSSTLLVVWVGFFLFLHSTPSISISTSSSLREKIMTQRLSCPHVERQRDWTLSSGVGEKESLTNNVMSFWCNAILQFSSSTVCVGWMELSDWRREKHFTRLWEREGVGWDCDNAGYMMMTSQNSFPFCFSYHSLSSCRVTCHASISFPPSFALDHWVSGTLRNLTSHLISQQSSTSSTCNKGG